MKIHINYSIPVTYTVVVERDELPDEDELLNTVTREEMLDGDGEITWDDVKNAWRYSDPSDVIVTDENHDELYLDV